MYNWPFKFTRVFAIFRLFVALLCDAVMKCRLIPWNLKLHVDSSPRKPRGVVGDEHGGGHRGAASSGKYSCDAPHRGSLAFPTTSKSVLQATVGGRNPAPVDVDPKWCSISCINSIFGNARFVWGKKRRNKKCKCQKNSRFRFDSTKKSSLMLEFFEKPLFFPVTFPLVPCFTRCIKWFKEGSLSFRSVCSTCPRSGWRSMT